jgi:hypothetical protein
MWWRRSAGADCTHARRRGTALGVADFLGQFDGGKLEPAGLVVVEVVGLQLGLELGFEGLHHARQARRREGLAHAEARRQPVGHLRLARASGAVSQGSSSRSHSAGAGASFAGGGDAQQPDDLDPAPVGDASGRVAKCWRSSASTATNARPAAYGGGLAARPREVAAVERQFRRRPAQSRTRPASSRAPKPSGADWRRPAGAPGSGRRRPRRPRPRAPRWWRRWR